MLTEEATKIIGKAGDVKIMEVEKGAIKKFADAVDDLNPFYVDEEYAKNSRYGSIIAPPGFFGWPTKWPKSGPTFTELREELIATMAKAGYPRLLDGGIEYDFFLPVRVGDTLSALMRVVSITERETKTGKIAFSVTEMTYTNQNGDLVAKERSTLIHR